jgi:hypothetical protein
MVGTYCLVRVNMHTYISGAIRASPNQPGWISTYYLFWYSWLCWLLLKTRGDDREVKKKKKRFFEDRGIPPTLFFRFCFFLLNIIYDDSIIPWILFSLSFFFLFLLLSLCHFKMQFFLFFIFFFCFVGLLKWVQGRKIERERERETKMLFLRGKKKRIEKKMK